MKKFLAGTILVVMLSSLLSTSTILASSDYDYPDDLEPEKITS